MYENYSNRVKDFITEMTFPEKKVTIDDITKKVTNARDDILSEGGLKKPFYFKGYLNENERIKETIKNNRYLYNFSEEEPQIKKKKFRSKIKTENNIKQNENLNSVKLLKNNFLLTNDELKNVDYFIKNGIIIQPQMRFKARTDLERVYENLIDNYDKNEEKEVLNRQLKNINLNSFQTPKDLIKIKKNHFNKIEKKNDKNNKEKEQNLSKNFLKYGYEIIDQNKYNNNNNNNKINHKNKNDLFYIPKNLIFKPWIKNKNLNIEAEKILNSYHMKTHFKAAEEIAENKLKTKEKKENKKNFSLDENENEFFNSKERFFISKNEINDSYNNNIVYENYTKNLNPFLEKESDKIEYNKNNFNLLSDLAFKKTQDVNPRKISEETKIVYNDNDKKKLVDENSVLIGNEIYYKNSQFDIIANKVLNSCNVYRQKSKHNDTNLKKKNGKLMITKGMTVNQFEKKFNFND